MGRSDVRLLEPPEHVLRVPHTPAPTIVWASPLERCAMPARWLAAVHGATLRLDDRLLELDMGDFTARRFEDLAKEEPVAWQGWMANWETRGPPGGESARQLEARVREWWERARLAPGHHLLVGHAGVIRALYVILRGLPWSDAMARAVPHSQPVILR